MDLTDRNLLAASRRSSLMLTPALTVSTRMLWKSTLTNKLLNPEALQFIRTSVTLMAKLNAPLCTITKAAAKSLGLLQ